jgi:hypothetical protein
MNTYTTALIFNSHEEFEAYETATKRAMRKLEITDVGLSKDLKVTVLVKTNLPIPSGLLTVKMKDGEQIREITIRVSSGIARLSSQTSQDFLKSVESVKEFY